MQTFSCYQIDKTYRTGCLKRTQKNVLTDITFEVKQHQVFGIIGLNGAGKSTMLKIFMGFVKPDSGTVSINETPVTSKDCHQQVGYLPENPSLYPHLSIKEHLQFGCRLAGLSVIETKKRIQTALEIVDLVDVEKMPIKSFSKGMTQRAAIAYTILLQPEILILDEPMSGLDPLGRQMVLDIIQGYQKQGATILFCSHILTDIERICDRIGIMHQGQLTSVVTEDILNKSYDSADGKCLQTPLEQYFLTTVQTDKT